MNVEYNVLAQENIYGIMEIMEILNSNSKIMEFLNILMRRN